MISITVGGKPLFIPKGTSLQIEANNPVFSTGKIEGDVMFTFDVPAEKNDTVFRHARYTYIRKVRKYQCSVLAGGIGIANGDLYLQKSTRTTYSCGLVINPFPEGYADRRLKDNDYGKDILISQFADTQRANWLEFLRSSLADDSVYKFPLFTDSEFYGSANKAFGWFLLPSENPGQSNPNGFQASLNTNDNVGLDKHYINRLFTDAGGNVVEEVSGNRGIRIFNNPRAASPNSFAFCPALRLVWLLEKVVENGGYALSGSFASDSGVRRLFAQSLRAMDGMETQYEDAVASANVTVSPEAEFIEQTSSTYAMPFNDGLTRRFRCLRVPTTGDYEMDITINTYLPANVVNSHVDSDYPDETHWQVLALILMEEDTPMPNFLNQAGYDAQWHNIGTLSNGDYYPIETYHKVYHSAADLDSFGYAGGGFYTLHHHFTQRLTAGVKYRIFFGILDAIVFGGNYFGMTSITGWHNSPVTNGTTYYNVCNVFSNRLRYSEHVPDLTNGNFIDTLCNAFGLAMFTDSETRRMEFSFFSDIVAKAKCIDLSASVLDKETSIEKREEKRYTYKLEGIEVNEMDETKILPPVRKSEDLPDAMVNYGRICFVENENVCRIAEREGDSIDNWVFRWNTLCGNAQTLEVGEGDEESVNPSVKVPGMRITDTKLDALYRGFVPDIGAKGCSALYDSGSTGFGLILLEYYGRKPLKTTSGIFYYEAAAPTCINADGTTEEGLSLTPFGESSVGEMYARPWLSFLANYEKVTLKLLLTLSGFLELWQLLKPQNCPVERQKRWIMADNVRYLPIKMTFQFTEGSRNVMATVECAKESE